MRSEGTPLMNPLKMVETSCNPVGVVCGINRPARASEMVLFGKRLKGAVDPAGPMLVAPNEFWKPI